MNSTTGQLAQLNARITGEIFARQRFGGVSRYCVEVALELNRLGLARTRIDANAHINEYLWHSRRDVHNNGWFLNRTSSNATRLCRFAQFLKNACVPVRTSEIVHASYYGHENLTRRSLARVTTFYDLIHERFGSDAAFHDRKKRCLDASDRCIAISEATKADMVHYLSADPAKISVVYLASRIAPTTERDALADRSAENYLLWVGGRSWYKNFETFARAYVRSRASREGVVIVCAGGPPISSAEREAWHDIGLRAQSVRYLRPSDDELAALYTNATALVYTSLFEGFGIPPLEAMTCNCPVLASNAGSIPEVVGDAALLVDPRSVEAIAYQIDNLLYQSGLAIDLRRRGRNQAASFSWTRCAIETHECYQKAIEAAGG